ncbi:TetR/AcrR family transcriptional regulator [Methanobacterium sp. SMA-27]|uniref:TetR/AcrR family transcriptional regulator n=1 Tax=Methanobacterium sp. SMA-27 TaxID=1495336 RepID=UPI00064E6A23|nr:TetR/AcrR family transcriptional regulator [Methanobacterium sp. SMA-27]
MTKAIRKEREREIRSNDIIATAEKLFFTEGYDNVAMSDIARETEMARGTLYKYFKNKDDIYAAIAIRASKIISEMFKHIDQKNQTGIEKIKTICITYYEFYKKHRGYYEAYYHSGMFENKESPNLENLRKIRINSFQVVIDALNEGIKDGSIRKEVDPAPTALIMLCMSNTVNNLVPVTKMYMENYEMTQDVLFENTLDLVMRSIERIK